MEEKDQRGCKRLRAACIGFAMRPHVKRCLLASVALGVMGLLCYVVAAVRHRSDDRLRTPPHSSGQQTKQDALLEATGDMLERWVAGAARANHTIQVLEVGACNGDFVASVTSAEAGPADGGVTTSKESNDVVQGLFGSPAVRAVLVEPNPPMFSELERNIKAAFGETHRLKAMQVAVCPDSSGTVPFYVVDSARYLRDYPGAPKWAAKQLSSMDRHHLVKHSRSLAMKRSEWEAYIQEIMVPCLTPLDLLNKATLYAAQVDLLQVDAEGFDGKIVRAFMALPRMEPKVIRFEQKHLKRDELKELMEFLRSRGYAVEKVKDDVVAWREPELQLERPA